MAASGAAQGLQNRKGQEQRQGAAQRSGHGSKVLAPRPEANRRAAALRQPTGKPGSRAPEAGQLFPTCSSHRISNRDNSQPLRTPSGLPQQQAASGVSLAAARAAVSSLATQSPVLFRACSGLHFVGIGSRRLVQDGVVICDSFVGCLIRASFLPGEGRRLGGREGAAAAAAARTRSR